MAEILKGGNLDHWVGEPIDVVKNKLSKKQPKMLEEQIRDSVPCDVELEEEKDEEF